ncbi:YafY family protein [Paenibacillus sp. NFR01]|uniref:helix-turn-helix transcriptional regulator n=1 Tax=Paenibacillus sp. NFR01 TaxID=1566279 RepID=UPI0008BF7B8A|nr:WYL domain-containing protein [Paenibacillus sp. NFR01]SET99350.1 Predicted DNA-binding transcriptional regulator YafY, contains an HTH and WYL domains [Paenibacillus sp. NFR01]
MTDRLIRLMRIITLVQAKPGILARELAERCGSSERTIYRDMDALSAMHIPITHMGHGKGYVFIGNFALYPLDLSDEESAAFSRMRGIMKEIKPMLPPEFESAYEKIMAAEYKQKKEREERIEIVSREAGLLRGERGGQAAEPPPFVADLLGATLKQVCIQADYSENAREEKDLQIDPYHLVSLENRYHLIGYCHRRRDFRAFHVDGFSIVRPLDRGFAKKSFDLQNWTNREWGLDQDSLLIDFKVRFSPRMMDWIKDEEMPVKPSKVDRLNRCLHFKVAIAQEASFVRWVMKFEGEAEIAEPGYYRDMLKNQLTKWLMLYK